MAEKKKMSAKAYAALEKREEVEHKDLDHDGEKGESAAHKAKVFGTRTPGRPVPKPSAKKPAGKKTPKKGGKGGY